MLRKIYLPSIFLFLGYGFWLSSEFKTIVAGVAIFLFGMLSMEEGFKTFTGGTLEKILRLSTDRLWKSISFGILATASMQSSSLLSVITISFLSVGLLDLISAIGIVFGANLGTTTGAWLVAGLGLKVNLATYAMPMLVFGIVLVLQKSRSLKGAGYILTGLGFLFLGIHYMKEGFDSFGQSIELSQYAVTGYSGVVAFAGIGILATIVMQSSHATLILILAALSVQQISYENALALAIGSNVGTTVTAMIGAIGAGPDGKRLAIAHFIFNVTTGLVAVLAIFQLIVAVAWISSIVGIAANNYTLQLAVFHTLFNIIGIVLMLPLIKPLVRLLEKLIVSEKEEVEEPVYLNTASLDVADVAVEAVRKESIRLYDLALGVIYDGLNIQHDLSSSKEKSQLVANSPEGITSQQIDELYERKLKILYGAIVEFTVKVKGGYAGESVREEFNELRHAGQNIIEAVKGVKHLNTNLTRFMRSNNVHIRKEYDRLRRLIIRVLDRIEMRRNQPLATDTFLDELRLGVKAKLEEINSDLDGLIRERNINVQMATSLMNDISYCRDITQHLVDAAAVLFSAAESANDVASQAAGVKAQAVEKEQ